MDTSRTIFQENAVTVIQTMGENLLEAFHSFELQLQDFRSSKHLSESSYQFFAKQINRIIQTINITSNSFQIESFILDFTAAWQKQLHNEGTHEFIFNKIPRQETKIENILKRYLIHYINITVSWLIIKEESQAITTFQKSVNNFFEKITNETTTQLKKVETDLTNIQTLINKSYQHRIPFNKDQFTALHNEFTTLNNFSGKLVNFDHIHSITKFSMNLLTSIYSHTIKLQAIRNEFVKYTYDKLVKNQNQLSKNELLLLQKQQDEYLQQVSDTKLNLLNTILDHYKNIEIALKKFPLFDEQIESGLNTLKNKIIEFDDKIIQFDNKLNNTNNTNIVFLQLNYEIKPLVDQIAQLNTDLMQFKQSMKEQQQNAIQGVVSSRNKIIDHHIETEGVDLQTLKNETRQDRLTLLELEIKNHIVNKITTSVLEFKIKTIKAYKQLLNTYKTETISSETPIRNILAIYKGVEHVKALETKLNELPSKLLNLEHQKVIEMHDCLQQHNNLIMHLLGCISNDKANQFEQILNNAFKPCFDLTLIKTNLTDIIFKSDVNTLINEKLSAFNEKISCLENLGEQYCNNIDISFVICDTHGSLINGNKYLKSKYESYFTEYQQLKTALQKYKTDLQTYTLLQLDQQIIEAKQISTKLYALKQEMYYLLELISNENIKAQKKLAYQAQLLEKEELRKEKEIYARLKTTPLADIADKSLHEKVIFLKYEGLKYSTYLRYHPRCDGINKKKYKIINHLNEILIDKYIDDHHKLTTYKTYFDLHKPDLIKNHPDNMLMRFIKLVLSIFAPSLKRRLEQGSGLFLVNTLTPIADAPINVADKSESTHSVSLQH